MSGLWGMELNLGLCVIPPKTNMEKLQTMHLLREFTLPVQWAKSGVWQTEQIQIRLCRSRSATFSTKPTKFNLKLFTTQSGLSMTLRKKPFGNIVRKEENASNQHFLLFPQFFISFQKQISVFYSNLFCRLQML